MRLRERRRNRQAKRKAPRCVSGRSRISMQKISRAKSLCLDSPAGLRTIFHKRDVRSRRQSRFPPLLPPCKTDCNISHPQAPCTSRVDGRTSWIPRPCSPPRSNNSTADNRMSDAVHGEGFVKRLVSYRAVAEVQSPRVNSRNRVRTLQELLYRSGGMP